MRKIEYIIFFALHLTKVNIIRWTITFTINVLFFDVPFFYMYCFHGQILKE